MAHAVEVDDLVVVRQTVFHDASRPSHVLLPVIER